MRQARNVNKVAVLIVQAEMLGPSQRRVHGVERMMDTRQTVGA